MSTSTSPQTWNVPDMSCQHCIDAITGEVSKVDGVTSVEIDLETKVVSVCGGDANAIVEAIDEAGFDTA